MSDLQSKTPICKANTYAASTGDADDYSPDFVPLEIAEKIELAANGLAEALDDARNVAYGKRETHEQFLERLTAMDAASEAFAALQPSPHDAPRTETK